MQIGNIGPGFRSGPTGQLVIREPRRRKLSGAADVWASCVQQADSVVPLALAEMRPPA